MDSQISTSPGSPALIVPATWRDLNALRTLEKVCFPIDIWPLWDSIAILSLPNVIRLKAVIEGEMVGFVAAERRPFKNQAWIASLGVLPAYRRQGIGTALLEACEDRLPDAYIRLSVRPTNHAALKLYERFGYQRVSVWYRYYKDGADAIVLEKKRL